jgi:formylglycine-generating enzyme required for sulfatase activity
VSRDRRRSWLQRHRRVFEIMALLLVVLSGCARPEVSPSAASSPGLATVSASPDLRPPACTEIGQTWVSPRDGATLVCVPAATFEMGTVAGDPGAQADTQPRHPVALTAFWIDRTEITNADYARCVALGVCPRRPTQPGSTGVASKTHSNYYYDPAFADYPVLIYTPEEAATYCTCMGRRLATEAEFEHAAAGIDGGPYPWGDTLDCDHASYLGCTTDTTDVETPGAGASAVGALNMAGNVWEWVSDYYAEDAYATSPIVDPTGPATGDYRVRRGGGYSSLKQDLRVTVRASGNPAHYFDGQMGFRCALGDAPS